MPRGSRGDRPAGAVTRYRDVSWLQDCRSGRAILQSCRIGGAALLPQQCEPDGIQDDVEVLKLVDERHPPLLQGIVHHGIAGGAG